MSKGDILFGIGFGLSTFFVFEYISHRPFLELDIVRREYSSAGHKFFGGRGASPFQN